MIHVALFFEPISCCTFIRTDCLLLFYFRPAFWCSFIQPKYMMPFHSNFRYVALFRDFFSMTSHGKSYPSLCVKSYAIIQMLEFVWWMWFSQVISYSVRSIQYKHIHYRFGRIYVQLMKNKQLQKIASNKICTKLLFIHLPSVACASQKLCDCSVKRLWERRTYLCVWKYKHLDERKLTNLLNRNSIGLRDLPWFIRVNY